VDNIQLEHWINPEYGHEYIERNNFAPWKLKLGVRGFRRILKGLEFQSLLEVGSNIGLNLWFISEWAKKRKQEKLLYAVEPYPEAYGILTSQDKFKWAGAFNESGYKLPFEDNSMDIAMTHGVLIHVAPENLKRMTDEIVRVAKKYVICTEYFSHEPEEVGYKGKEHLIFKRDFGKWYLDNYPNLKCINYGFLWQQEFCDKKQPHPYGTLFDDLNYWVFEKRS
jgi:pseudaminic acid biosynthesis-associated methylase